jgi:hypothetical protein
MAAIESQEHSCQRQTLPGSKEEGEKLPNVFDPDEYSFEVVHKS